MTKEPTPIEKMVPPGWHLTKDAAKLVGKSSDTLRRWRREGIFIPEGEMPVGPSKMKVNLYSDEDIKKMRALIPTMRPGRRAPRDVA